MSLAMDGVCVSSLIGSTIFFLSGTKNIRAALKGDGVLDVMGYRISGLWRQLWRLNDFFFSSSWGLTVTCDG